jgi:retinol dehydrogenase-14
MKRNNMKPMAGRTMAVTGATGGIGKATAHGLAQMGAHLVIIGCDPQRTEETAEAMRSAGGGKVGAFVADLSSPRCGGSPTSCSPSPASTS